ncbi:DNA/RNA nuclease SfsA [Myxococcota bacterium]|nr:DNA/RNA nuclease SfsA [Myxococcota bacterium]MBU1430835.1 DNA/RNA nuclease SfsA [Myxococcota bacterium]MBU1899573.1 DNA/RNA nuclease SfsA [Myxococcota bacterium]
MRIDHLQSGVFLRRYKRFFADVRLETGEEIAVHCPNSGSMKRCLFPGNRAWISDSRNPKRKLRHTLEILELDEGALGLMNTQRPNALAEEAIRAGWIEALKGWATLQREVRYGQGSRIDLLLTDEAGRRTYVEVKNVTMGVGGGLTRFPDAVTARGTKHLNALISMVEAGHRAVMLFCAGRDDTQRIEPADDIDPTYGQALRRAAAAGVELLGYRCRIAPPEITLCDPIPVVLPPHSPKEA